MLPPGSNERVWWLCEAGHEWPAPIYHRVKGSGCPYCAGNKATKTNNLALLRPDLAAEWHFTKNGKLIPSEVTPKSDRRVWWMCTKSHEWLTSVKNRTGNGTGCPYCLGRRASKDDNLAIRFPGLAAQWHPTRNGNLKASDVTPGSAKKVWWLCENNHEWQAIIKNRTRWPGCSQCRKEQRVRNPL